jgi:hypothetical protein
VRLPTLGAGVSSRAALGATARRASATQKPPRKSSAPRFRSDPLPPAGKVAPTGRSSPALGRA